jgi:hypothetical protein
VAGVVATVEGQKAKELDAALEQGKDIITTTLQTFPFVAERIGDLPGRRFAVVIDEAHSSQSGETNRSLREVLYAPSLDKAEEVDAGQATDDEDVVNQVIEATMKRRGRLPNVSFFAFTATPKSKTLELFGARQPDGTFTPFSLYSMRQAIEEGFILDVLQNYTTYNVYFSLLKRIQDDPRYDRKKAIFLLRSYFVGLPPELSDAAKVDGCSDFGVFTRIVMPLSWPAFGSVGLIIGVWTWNEFIFAVTFLHSDQTETVAVRFNSFVGQYVSNYAYMAAAGVIMILPAVLAFLSLQRRFIAGLTSGALKT